MLRQFAGKSGFTFLVYYVGKGEEDKSIPADHSEVEQIRKPHEPSNPQDDHTAITLLKRHRQRRRKAW
jgi:hypothetical protein